MLKCEKQEVQSQVIEKGNPPAWKTTFYLFVVPFIFITNTSEAVETSKLEIVVSEWVSEQTNLKPYNERIWFQQKLHLVKWVFLFVILHQKNLKKSGFP